MTMVPSQPMYVVTIGSTSLYLQPVQLVAFLGMEVLLISRGDCYPLVDLPPVEEKFLCIEIARLLIFRALPSEM